MLALTGTDITGRQVKITKRRGMQRVGAIRSVVDAPGNGTVFPIGEDDWCPIRWLALHALDGTSVHNRVACMPLCMVSGMLMRKAIVPEGCDRGR